MSALVADVQKVFINVPWLAEHLDDPALFTIAHLADIRAKRKKESIPYLGVIHTRKIFGQDKVHDGVVNRVSIWFTNRLGHNVKKVLRRHLICPLVELQCVLIFRKYVSRKLTSGAYIFVQSKRRLIVHACHIFSPQRQKFICGLWEIISYCEWARTKR